MQSRLLIRSVANVLAGLLTAFAAQAQDYPWALRCSRCE